MHKQQDKYFIILSFIIKLLSFLHFKLCQLLLSSKLCYIIIRVCSSFFYFFCPIYLAFELKELIHAFCERFLNIIVSAFNFKRNYQCLTPKLELVYDQFFFIKSILAFFNRLDELNIISFVFFATIELFFFFILTIFLF